jgi:hypothetical protein
MITIIHEDGKCKVPIYHQPDMFAVLYEEDLEELIKLGVKMQWKWQNGNVWSQNSGQRLSIARLILDAGVGEQVLFLDRDPLNLLRENLIIAPGGGRYRARDQIVLTHSFLKDKVEVEHDVR